MNISDLNNKIYGHRDLKQGEYANFMLDIIEQQKEININMNNINDKSNEINKEIKF